MTVPQSLLRTLIGFFLLLLVVRFIGKKQLGELALFNYITGIALGNIAGDMVVHADIRVIDAIAGISLWALLTFLLAYISLKLPKARVLLNGEPAIVIKKGVILRDSLAANRINLDYLNILLRNNNIFSIKDVDYAILEPNGKLSVLKKPGLETITKNDMNIQSDVRNYLPSEIIVDGNIIERNLKEYNLNSGWLGQHLIQAGIQSVKDVFYAEIQEDGSLHVIKK